VTDSALRTGWNVRGYNWEFSAGVQRQLIPRVSLDVSYFRRIFGNFTVTDDLARAATDYTFYSVTAPSDPRLPDGGGYTVTGIPNVNPNVQSIAAQNSTRLSDSYGNETQHWNGVDVGLNARLTNGLNLNGGFGTGRTSTDACDIVSKLPEMLTNFTLPGIGAAGGAANTTPLQYCKVTTPFLTGYKAAGSYMIPKVLVQVAATYQNIPGSALQATYNVPNAVAKVTLGRDLANSATNQGALLLSGGTEYQERLSQLDMRIGKLVRLAGTKTNISLDIFNAFNSETILNQNNALTLGANGAANTLWVPTSILQARFFKISAQFDF